MVNERSYTEYITWRKQYDGSVALGHYHNDNLQAAKEDFAKRSELVDEARLFSHDEMAVIYKAIMEYDRSDTIDYNDKKLLHHIEGVRNKLSQVPDVDRYAKINVLIVEPQKSPYEAQIYCEPYAKYQTCETELQRAATVTVDVGLLNANVRDLQLDVSEDIAQSLLENSLTEAGWTQEDESWVKYDDGKLINALEDMQVTAEGKTLRIDATFAMPSPWTLGGVTEICIPMTVLSSVLYIE